MQTLPYMHVELVEAGEEECRLLWETAQKTVQVSGASTMAEVWCTGP